MENNTEKINVCLVDDDKLIVELMSEFLNSQEGLFIGSSYFSGNSVIVALEKLKTTENLPNVMLLDLKMKDGDGMEVIDVVTKDYPDIQIIVLSSYYRDSFLGQMLKKGIHAFIPKETDKNDVVKIIHEVHQKGHFFTTGQISTLREQVSSKTPQLNINSKDALSEREIEVLKLICNQHTAKEIAEKLFISHKTVEAHKSNLMIKTGVRNTAGLIIYAVKNKIIDAESIFLID